jgi:hypothetical protein
MGFAPKIDVFKVKLHAFLIFFYLVFTTSLIWFGDLASSSFSLLSIAVAGDRIVVLSLLSSASVTTETTNNECIFNFLRIVIVRLWFSTILVCNFGPLNTKFNFFTSNHDNFGSITYKETLNFIHSTCEK